MADVVADEVEAWIGSSWTAADNNVLPVRGLNLDAQPPADGSPFIEIEYPLENETQHELGNPGNNAFKGEGAFRIVLNESRGIGTARASGWITQLRALFRGKNLGTVQCFEANRAVINDANDLGNYWQMSFTVRYWTYVTG